MNVGARTLPPDIEQELVRLEQLAGLLDARFALPGTGIRIGLDSVVGLIPGVGDTVMLLPSLYMIMKARGLGVPFDVLAQMAVNSLIDFSIGTIPVVGDLFDVAFKANRRNVALMRHYLTGAGG